MNMVDYKSAGVDAEKKEGALSRLLDSVLATFNLNACKPLLPVGFYANVIDLTPAGFAIGIAFSTDGVGTKILVADQMKKYDTLGIDCVAMNVNDIICVGAVPVSMVDYIAVSRADANLLSEIGKGLRAGCELAGINLCGGELAQVAELLAPAGDGVAFDIVGTAIGTVSPDRILTGQNLQEGDLLVGLESSGLHSNGYTLARRICFEVGRFSIDQSIPELQRTVGETLLEPTRIYVKEVLEILNQVPVKALFHITGDGLFNLTRTSKAVSYRIENFPEPPAVFRWLQKTGNIPNEEMFRVFNMGIGFVLAIPDNSDYLSRVETIASKSGYKAHRLGFVLEDPSRTITVVPYGIAGKLGRFVSL